MQFSQRNDRQLTRQQIQTLSSADQLADFLAYLRYPEEARLKMTPDALQLPQRLRDVTRSIERLTSVESGALQVYLFELTSVTVARTRALARAFRNRAGNFLLVLTDDYERIDFVLLEREVPGLTSEGPTRRGVTVRPRVLSVDRRDAGRVALRVLRRFTFTEYGSDDRRDPYAQWDKLKSAYTIAEWSEPLFNNRALFSDYYLNERLPDHPAWDAEERNQAFRAVRKGFAGARRRFAGEDAATIRSELIRPLLETLGFRVGVPSPPGGEGQGEGPVPDFLLYPGADDDPAAFVLAYPWNRYLDGKDDKRDDERPEENPGAQVVTLLEAGAADWGIVTNGKSWRLYSARAHSRATNTYEVNLEETLASPDPGEPFRYFYLFFRAEAFAPEERPVAGEVRELTFLDWLMEESQTYARELGERLKERVFEEIFPHFAAGFIHSMGGPERLQALPEEEREAELDRVYQGTLTFLYRLLFLLYAESRDLLPVREVRGYYRISLRRLCEEIAEQAGPLEDLVPHRLEEAYPLPRHSESIPNASEGPREESPLYDRLLDLFKVIDDGSAARNVPTYNGGLFITDPDEGDTGREAEAARFLEEMRLPDRYLALGLDRLARDVDPKRKDLGFIDYKSLGVRQLGSIYEGLLEFNIEIAEEDTVDRPSSTVYLVSDKGERKATGSYYTPDYIVKYIVRHTVGPVLDEKLDALRPRLHETEQHFRKVVKRKVELEGVTPDEPMLLQNVAGCVLHDLFDVKILDPAMGSGHFLVEAVDYVTDRLVRFLDGFPFLGVFFEGMRRSILREMERQEVTVDPSQLTDVTLLKRHVLKRCIYGVDLNAMAVELAKVSLWLDCFTLGAPLSFLDHHLRWGNSLIGAMAQEVEEEMGEPTPEGQMTFLTGPFVGLLQAADVMQVLSRLADVTLEQVRESRSLFDDFEQRARPFKQLLDIHVAQHFGVERAQEFLTLYGAEAMEAQKEELGKPYREVVEKTRELYEQKRFFHWDLEFPEVFIDLERAAWKKDGGFDAVVGNPPYVSAWSMTKSDPGLRSSIAALTPHGETLGAHWDLYIPFLLKAHEVVRNRGRFSFIIPNPFSREKYATDVREFLLEHTRIHRIVSFGQSNVFDEVSRQTLVPVFSKRSGGLDEGIIEIDDPYSLIDTGGQVKVDSRAVSQAVFYELPGFQFRHEVDAAQFKILDKIERYSVHLGNLCYVNYGAQVSSKKKGGFGKAEMVTASPKGNAKTFFEGKDLSRYEIEWSGLYLNYQPNLMYGPRAPELFESRKIVIRHVSAQEDSLLIAYDEKQMYCDHSLILAVKYSDIAGSGLRQVFEGYPTFEEPYGLTYLLPVAASSLESFYYGLRFATGSLQRSYSHVYPQHVRALPIRRIHFATPKRERDRLVAELIALYEQSEREVLLDRAEALLPRSGEGEFIAFQPGATGAEEKSDVVHDLLAYLAEQMIAMHEEKQEQVAAFWDDLEAACESPSTFEDLREHGKWEQSLWKDPACRPYVDKESRSTRHLDESLSWDEACYEAFAGLLAGKTSVTRPMIDVYRKHHSEYKALVRRIAATDDLIDQIVYRLYGLTEEEIAVVEGRTTSDERNTR